MSAGLVRVAETASYIKRKRICLNCASRLLHSETGEERQETGGAVKTRGNHLFRFVVSQYAKFSVSRAEAGEPLLTNNSH